MDINKIKSRFTKLYGSGGELHTYRSPGRVNLIGEHTDYNGGRCFPCALSLGIAAAARRTGGSTVRLASENFTLRAEFDAGSVVYDADHGWANYPKGVFSEILKTGRSLSGMDILISGDLPAAAGLSSSASLELLTCVMLNDAFGLGLTTIEMIRLCQRAENLFVGVNCGIMDQFAVAMGKKDSAILLDCRSLAFEYVPLKLDGMSIVIGDTKYARGLADSKYNERRAECERAVEVLRDHLDVGCLSDVSLKDLEKYKNKFADPTILRRARHVISENARVAEAAKCLKRGDLKAFGRLMNESHFSLKDDYEVTGAHLDALSGAARKADGCLGSRMTGAGFGGSTVSVVENRAIESFIETVSAEYELATGLRPEFYVAEAADGAGRYDAREDIS